MYVTESGAPGSPSYDALRRAHATKRGEHEP
jgi:hypothetical protein